MAESRAITRYVKSLLGLAEEQKSLDAVHNDMLLFSKVCDENRAFNVMLKSPVIRHELKKQILVKLFRGKVNELTLSFFRIITQKNREPLLPSIAREFHRAYNEYKGIGKATIVTTVALDENLRHRVEEIVKEICKSERIELEEKIDAGMIGGFVLTVGDRQVDASIKSKLKNLRTKFMQNPYAKGF